MMKYWAIFKTQVINNLAYPGDLVSRSLTIVMFMIIFTQLWKSVYATVGNSPNIDSMISGLTLRHTLWYLMLAETIILSKPRLSSTIATSVRDGSIAYILNKPYNFLLYQASVGLGDSLIHMVLNILAGGALVWILLGPPPSPAGWPLAFVAMTLAWLIDFCLSAMIGLSAFLTEDVSAFEWIYSKLLFLLGGLLLPLDFFPAWLRTIAQFTPFAYTVYGPARLFTDPSLSRFGNLLLGQIGWLTGLGFLTFVLYRKGVAWLTINGG